MSEECSSSQTIFEDNLPGDYKTTHSVEKNKLNIITPLKILNLCANLSNYSSSKRIQILINMFLKQITKSENIVIIPLLTNSEEGIIQVIDDKVLDNEIRFTVRLDDIRNASANGFHFATSDMNRDFREFVESVIGTGVNMLYFDIKEINKNIRSTLPAVVPPNENSFEPKPATNTDCRIILNGDMKLPPITNDGNLQVSFFICMAGDESLRLYYRYCIYETLRFTVGHLLTAIELDEMERIRNKFHKLLKTGQNLLGRIDGALVPNYTTNTRVFSITIDKLESRHLLNKFFYEGDDFSKLIEDIGTSVKQVIGAEQCCLFLRDKFTGELVTKFDASVGSFANNIRIEKSYGIVGHVVETGKILNIRNVANHPQFDGRIDKPRNVNNIRNILSFPIVDRNSVIGVFQLYNKINGHYFDKSDEELTTAFSIYIGFAIMNSLVNLFTAMTELRIKIHHELLMYHTKISEEEINELITSLDILNKKRIPNLSSFTFRTRNLTRFQSFKAAYQMFQDLDFINKFNLRREKLAKFFIVVEACYRDLPYHNWMHAFTVAHFAYALLMNCKLVEKRILSELEALAFIISTFCHDIDHRGQSNSFHLKTNSNIAQLHKTEGSVNERHHLSETIYILNDENINLLEGLTPEEFRIIIDTTKEFILATDLAHHFKTLSAMAESYNHTNEENRHLTMSLLMTCSDLSDQIKDWPNCQQISVHIYNEFFAQGDLEKQFGITPEIYMDRKRAIIPQLQCEFLMNVVTPAFQILGNILPETKYLLDIINDNFKHWQTLIASNE